MRTKLSLCDKSNDDVLERKTSSCLTTDTSEPVTANKNKKFLKMREREKRKTVHAEERSIETEGERLIFITQVYRKGLKQALTRVDGEFEFHDLLQI